ncbi:amidohydrolase family protein [Piscirickettsia litoralis]|uniref:Amidohydrolase-related domain-containing protein n=1 Tax=Piscirickettsia litoralis TaxID=1891921 RepID=A0ABX3A7M4_9GAMM|nr:amidohydrolase family protein [Piscirickettsia litoralis]ODN43520.1 hypothetical protein BGC07_12080 [Piscirickettsia litoralis]
MKIFDSHNHIWECKGEHFSWITEEMSIIKRDFSIDDLLMLSEENNVQYNLLVQAVPEVWETEKLLAVAEQNERIAGVIGWVDVAKGRAVIADIKKLIEQSDKLCGIRYMSQGIVPEHLIQEKFVEGVRSVGQLGLIYELLVNESQLEYVEKLISLCPDVLFVLNHIAKPDIKQGRIKAWSKAIENIARFQNVHCKLSGMVTEADLKNMET